MTLGGSKYYSVVPPSFLGVVRRNFDPGRTQGRGGEEGAAGMILATEPNPHQPQGSRPAKPSPQFPLLHTYSIGKDAYLVQKKLIWYKWNI